jgi:hypothetical protein
MKWRRFKLVIVRSMPLQNYMLPIRSRIHCATYQIFIVISVAAD